MNKLIDYMDWMTLEDSAIFLSPLFDKPLSVANVLRFGLEGKLKLSVYFANYVIGQLGKVIQVDDAEQIDDVHINASYLGEPDRVFEPSYKDEDIDGVWDLIMVGNGRLDIERRSRQPANNAETPMHNIKTVTLNYKGRVVEPLNTSDVLVERGGEIFQLQQQVLFSEGKKWTEDFQPADNIPDESTIVVRKDELLRFKSLLSEGENDSDGGSDKEEAKKKGLPDKRIDAVREIVKKMIEDGAFSPSQIRWPKTIIWEAAKGQYPNLFPDDKDDRDERSFHKAYTYVKGEFRRKGRIQLNQ